MTGRVLFEQVCRELSFDGDYYLKRLETESPEKIISEHTYNYTDRHYEYNVLAGAIIMMKHYERCPTTVLDYVVTFSEYLDSSVVAFLVRHRDVLQETTQKNFIHDFCMTHFAASTMISTYLAKIKGDDNPKEIPQFCFLRIAVAQFHKDGLEPVLEFYEALSSKKGICATPTIFNMGFRKGAPTSCIIITTGDSMDDILDTLQEAAMASKNNAGIGVDLSRIRHSEIGSMGKSDGIVPLCRLWDSMITYVNQGGRRPGACTVSLRVHHIDIMEFIGLTDKAAAETSRVNRLNTSIMLSDMFMKRCRAGGRWTVFCPAYTPLLNDIHGEEFEAQYERYEIMAEMYDDYLKNPDNYDVPPAKMVYKFLQAETVMKNICDMQIKSGMPYIIHGCNANRKNNMSNTGPVRSSNLCQEIMIPAVEHTETGCCNLASLSLKYFVKDGEFDFDDFASTVRLFTRSLNRVVDYSGTRVSEKASRSNSNSRPIGLGVSGFADMVAKLDMTITDVSLVDPGNYSISELKKRKLNPELAELTRKIWSCMYYNACLESVNEAKKYGKYPKFEGSPLSQGHFQFDLWKMEELSTGRIYRQNLDPHSPEEWGQAGSWDDLRDEIKEHGIRNALLLTCMPTASSANIIENCESTEFHMQNIYLRKTQSGDYTILNYDMIRDLESIDLWNKDTCQNILDNKGSILGISEDSLDDATVKRLRHIKEKYITMYELPQKIIIQLAGIRQVFIDHSQSMNLYMPAPNVDILKAVHMMTWETGLKTGIYYLRSRSAMEPLKFGREHKKVIKALEGLMCNMDEGCLTCSS